MSKLGKKPILIPKDTKVKLESGRLTMTGPKGSKEMTINDKIFATSIEPEKSLILKLIKKNADLNVIWGTTRSNINSAIIGVSQGFEKILELTGVGFRALLNVITFVSEMILIHVRIHMHACARTSTYNHTRTHSST